MPQVNITLGDKGGIGKSYVTAGMAQYRIDNIIGKPPLLFDLDYKTMTFHKYKGLDVELINVETDGDIEKKKFDGLVNRIALADDDDVFLFDIGSNVYIPLMNYMLVNEVMEMLVDHGVEIVLHVVIMGGQELNDTLNCLSELAIGTPEGVALSVWINQKNGKVESNGKTFEQSKLYEEVKDRIRTITYIPEWRPDMQHNVSDMLQQRVTYKVALTMDKYEIMDKQRLQVSQRSLYQAIRVSGVCS